MWRNYLLFPLYWEETLKIFSNHKSKMCSKMHFFSCKVQYSQSTELKENLFSLIFLSAISLSPVFSLSSRMKAKYKDKRYAPLPLPEVVSQVAQAQWRMLTLIQLGWCEFFCPCLDWHWPLKPTTSEHITWETIQSLTGKICTGNVSILHGIQ